MDKTDFFFQIHLELPNSRRLTHINQTNEGLKYELECQGFNIK